MRPLAFRWLRSLLEGPVVATTAPITTPFLVRSDAPQEGMTVAKAAPETGVKVNSKPNFDAGDIVREDRIEGAFVARVSAVARDIAAKAAKVKRLAKPQVSAALREVFALVPGVKVKLRRLRSSTTPALRNLPRFDERTFSNAAGTRTYKLFIPSSFNGNPLPLVVMLHGCGQSPDDFAAGTQMNALAEERSFLVAYPAQTPSANFSKCWNWQSAADQRRDFGEPSLIAGITRQIMEEYPVQRGRVYVAGLSAGGAAAAVMGSVYPDLYAAVGVHSGLACGAASDMGSAFFAMLLGRAPPRGDAGPALPTIVFHGDRDTTVHPANGGHVIAQSKAGSILQTTISHGHGVGGMAYTCTVQSDESGHPILEHWELHGAGHAWSGGSLAGSYTEPRGPDATREMIRFFLSHPRRLESYLAPLPRGKAA
jgi:poly(hydroxyalkanoate) depolymerase family esterase